MSGKEMYKKRTVVERTFSSLKRSQGCLIKHQYLTQGKVRAHIALSVLTYVGTMLVRESWLEMWKGMRQMRIRV